MKRLWSWLQWVVNRPVHRISTREALAVAGFAAVLFLSLNFVLLGNSDYSMRLKASKLMRQGAEVLREEYLARGLDLDPDIDSDLAGVIGPPSSKIVTVSGNLRDKVLSARPDMAVLVLDMLVSAGVKEGDVVAIGATGSFPALNLGTLIAVESLGATPLLISSIGSSNWGATNPEYTWLDMERVLFDSSMIHTRSIAASLGGSDDRGLGMPPGGTELALEAVRRNGIPLITHSGGIEDAVARRVDLFQSRAAGPIKAYVNIGGGVVSLGLVEERQLPPGLTLPSRNNILNFRSAGLYYLSQKIPVINLDGIGSIAAKYGITGDAGGIGRAQLYYKGKILRLSAGAALALLLISLYLVGTGRFDRWLHPRDWQS